MRFRGASPGHRGLSGQLDQRLAVWCGATMSEPDPVFWASKLHFYISGIAFYNFPYLFGYLFSNAVYLQRAAN